MRHPKDRYPYEETWKSLTPQQQRDAERRAKQARLTIPDILRIRYVVSNPIPIMYRANDQILHTNESPWCDDPACGCHILIDNLEAFDRHIEQPLQNGLLTTEEARRIYWNKQL
jgi:hypothetical protein